MKYITLVLSFMMAVAVWSQDLNYQIKGKITNQDLGTNEGGVTVSMIHNGTTIASTTSASNGKYTLNAAGPKTGKYEIVYSKSGMVSKKIAFDGSKMNEEDIPAGNEIPFPLLDMDMFAQRPNVDFSFLNTEYVASFYWDEKKFALDFDRVASEKVRKKIDDLLLKAEKDKSEAEMKYQQAIQKADLAYGQKNYTEALAKYEEALGYKPAEKYPADKIVELDALIQAQKNAELAEAQANAAYNNLITAADNLKSQDKLPEALAKYQEALTKKDEQYPKDQIAALKITIENRKKEAENQALYDAAITKADMFLKQNSLQAARDKYTEAGKLKPSEQYPKDKLAEIDKKIKDQEAVAAKKQKYDEAIAAADIAFGAENYTVAKTKYEEALTFESASTYAKDRVKLCDAKILETKLAEDKLKKIADLLDQGNKAIPIKDYTTAKSKFDEVLALDPQNAEAKEKLELIKQKVEEEKAVAEKQKTFTELVKAGDNAVAAKKYEEAIAKYEAALLVNNVPEVDNKLKDARTQLLALQKAQESKAEYDKAIAEGNKLLSEKNLEAAKAKFTQASTLDPSQTLPKDKLKEIENLVAAQKAEADKKAKLDLAINEANHNFDIANWTEASKKYREVLVLDPNNTYAKQRIVDIDGIVLKEKESAARKAQIETLLTDGKTLKTQKKLEDAKKKFEEVLKLDPNNQEASAQITDVNAQIAAKQSEAEKETTFNKLKAEGFDLATKKQYNDAKLKLQEALALKEDVTVRTKLDEVILKIQEQTSQQALDDQYNKLISEAQSLSSNSEYANAILKYQAALKIKPNETMPKTSIAELETKLQANSDQKKIDEEYKKIMTAANALMAQEKYLDAIQEYNKALTLKPNEQEPVDKAAEAERLERLKGKEVDEQYEKILTVAEEKIGTAEYDRALELVNRAKGLKPEDPRPQQMLVRINQLKADDAAYKVLMNEGQTMEVSKKYIEAKSKYTEASKKKPNDQLAKDKIDEMQRKIDEMSNAAQNDTLYNEYMANGAKYFTKLSYQQALSEYQNALSVRQNDLAAQNKIKEIEQILDNIANANANDAAKKNQFDQLVKEADGKFSGAEYLVAKAIYEKALAIDPSSSYVRKQIDECVRQERDKGNVEAEREYQKIITAADNNFNKASYDKAKEYYLRALTLKNNDPYPKQKLAEIQAILNPTTIASNELEDLGDPYDNSIMDGQALLEKAEAERKSRKGTRMKKGLDEIQVSEEKMTREKTQDAYDNTNEIYRVQRQVIINEGESDLGRQETIEAIRASEFERKNIEAENMKYEHSENILNQGVLDVVTDEVALDYGVRESVYTENTDILTTYNTAQAERISAEIDLDKKRNISTDQDLTEVKLQIDEGVRDDYDDRAEVRKDVVDAENKAVDIQLNKSEGTYEKVLDNRDEVRKIEIAYDQKSVEDAKAATGNEQELVDVRSIIVDAEAVRTEKEEVHLYKADSEIADVKELVSVEQIAMDENRLNSVEVLKEENQSITDKQVIQTGVEYTHAYKTDSEMAAVKELVSVEQAGMDENRQNTVEVIKEGNKELADAHFEAYNDEVVKYVTNKEIINEEVEFNNAISEKAEASHEKKIEYVETMDKKANVEFEENQLSDQTERLNSKKGIEVVYTDVQESTSDSGIKLEENTTTLKDMNRTIEADKTNQAIGDKEKHFDNAEKINDVDASPQKKVISANELGKEYPEGVSQESFTQKDNDGLMTAIITRRVVVINGHATVYVRTQTLHGITYSKNGEPSLDHVWNKETQGPELERHF